MEEPSLIHAAPQCHKVKISLLVNPYVQSTTPADYVFKAKNADDGVIVPTDVPPYFEVCGGLGLFIKSHQLNLSIS